MISSRPAAAAASHPVKPPQCLQMTVALPRDQRRLAVKEIFREPGQAH